jgi:hypothetical protein
VVFGKFTSFYSFSIFTVFQKFTGLGRGGRPMHSAPAAAVHRYWPARPNGCYRSDSEKNVNLRKLHLLTLHLPRTGGKNPLLFNFSGETRRSTSKFQTKARHVSILWRNTRQIVFRSKKGGLQSCMSSSTRIPLLKHIQPLCKCVFSFLAFPGETISL